LASHTYARRVDTVFGIIAEIEKKYSVAAYTRLKTIYPAAGFSR
jgi:hypothetical protein